MYSFQQLTIEGYHNEATPHSFFQQDQETDHAAIIFPGVRYTCQHPLLYYPTKELLLQGADVLWVEYNQRPSFTSLSETETVRCITTDASTACQALLHVRPYRQITLIGKSIGTAAMIHVLNEASLPLQLRAIWLTPLLRRKELCEMIQQARPQSLFVIGTADSHYDKKTLAQLQTVTKGDTLVIDHADHSLEIDGNVQQSIQIMGEVIQAIQAFLR